jgi:hypothetical protein
MLHDLPHATDGLSAAEETGIAPPPLLPTVSQFNPSPSYSAKCNVLKQKNARKAHLNEIKSGINSGNACYYSVQNLFFRLI